jgi:hypothetical protein
VHAAAVDSGLDGGGRAVRRGRGGVGAGAPGVQVPGQPLHRHAQRQGGDRARLQGARGRAGHGDPERAAALAAAEAAPASRPADQRVDPNDQKARDHDKRRILESELRREEERLAGLRQEYNNGQPERRGEEKNYQKYLDRTAELKAGIERSESDIAALKRELSKLPPVN